MRGQQTFVDKSKPKDMRTSNILAGKCKRPTHLPPPSATRYTSLDFYLLGRDWGQ